MQEFELLPRAVDKTKTGSGTDMWKCKFQSADGFDFNAVTFSETLAALLETAIKDSKKVKIECSVKDSQYGKNYTIMAVDGQKNSGFGARGQGYKKDQVGIERTVSAKIVGDWLNINAPVQKDFEKSFEKLADKVYVWISKRPTGTPEQAPGPRDEDAPVDLNKDLPPEW